MNRFESLCRLASDENWCWKLYCTTCGHMHFTYGFAGLAAGRSPDDDDWAVHADRPIDNKIVGPYPGQFTELQKAAVLGICRDASLESIAGACRFPDWLGYLGLVLEDLRTGTAPYRELSSSWAGQLETMVPAGTAIRHRLHDLSAGEGILDIGDLQKCEHEMFRSRLYSERLP